MALMKSLLALLCIMVDPVERKGSLYLIFFEMEEQYDVGRVSIFTFDEQYNRFIRVASVSGEVSRGRFGSSLLNAGDLNGDGNEDLIVGSPYEDEGRGAIRLYLGNSKRIINRDFVQTIKANSMDRKLFGFGISFAKALDIDDNSVRDIAVGSNGKRGEGGSVVILRGRPTGYIKLYVEPSVDEIDFSTTKELSLLICVELKSRIQSDMNYISKAKISIEGDSRTILNNKHPFWSSNFIRVEQNLKQCFPKITVNLSPSLNPGPDEDSLIFNIRAETEEWDVFCSHCGITEPSRDVLEIPFIMDCFVDDGGTMRCYNDLGVSAYITEIRSEPTTYIMGSTDIITLNIDVTNNENSDPAFQPMVKILYPKELSLVRNLNQCKNIKSTHKLVCSLKGPIRPGGKSSFKIEFDTKNLVGSPFDGPRQLVFPEISVYSKSLYAEDNNNSNNREKLSIDLVSEADFHILVEDEGKLTNSSVYFNSFNIKKKLQTPMHEIQTEILIPVSDDKGNLFVYDELIRIENPLGEKLPCDQKIIMQKNPDLVSNKANTISCYQNSIRCLQIKCPGISIHSQDESAHVSLRFSFNERFIRTIINNQHEGSSPLYIEIEGRVLSGYLKQELNVSPDTAIMKALLTPQKTIRTMFLLMTVGVCVFLSILFLIIIIFILYKCKVFDRKSIEQMEEEDEPMMDDFN
ncbi:integrin alpha-PS4 [Lepeophtheirus salmonis]|uniref:integrin alpha-PS4 n=1 Tax=Lepeophtheirus salmonis TaxID=72036 RepID=UPI001AEB04FE|nr:integrin alpha-4-like [Lepeophtheirus salmonis]